MKAAALTKQEGGSVRVHFMLWDAAGGVCVPFSLCTTRTIYLCTTRTICTPPHTPSRAAGTPSVLAVLLGPDGLGSTCASEVTAAQLALRAAASVAPGPVLAQLLDALAPWLDRAAHDLLSDAEIAAFSAPPGMLAAEAAAAAAGVGGYQAEVVASRNVRRPRGRFKVRCAPLFLVLLPTYLEDLFAGRGGGLVE